MLAVVERRERYSLRALLEELEELYRRARSALDMAESSGHPGLVCVAIREARSVLEFVYRMARDQQQEPEWLQVARQIAAALEPYPDARQAVLTVLRQHGHLP